MSAAAATPTDPDQTMPTWFTGVAPGRLDVLGGIADYSGSMVLEVPIRQQARVRLRLTGDGLLRASSTDPGCNPVAISWTELGGAKSPDPARWQEHARLFPDQAWGGYVLGTALVLVNELGLRIPGLELEVQSDVPSGKGVSSSAAIEVATLRALCDALDLNLPGTSLARLAQHTENHVVGAPCGLMDQLTVQHGIPGKLLPILCRPDECLPPLELPDDVGLVGIDSGIRHAVTGASYATVRAAAFMGWALLCEQRGISPQGYLTELEPADAHLLPESMDGKTFLASGRVCPDPVTQVEPGVHYPIRAATSFPLLEHRRVSGLVADYGKDGPNASWLRALGEAMFASHQGYSDCGIGHQETDAIVHLAHEAGVERGILGARVTGGGSGGTVAILYQGEVGREAVENISGMITRRGKGGGHQIVAI